jgi:putative PEP-CTERM system histidine kinase
MTTEIQFTIAGIASHVAAAAGYFILFVFLARRGIADRVNVVLALAVLATGLWAASVAADAIYHGDVLPILAALGETLRSASWIAFLVILLTRLWRESERVSFTFMVAVALGFIFALQLAIDISTWLFHVVDAAKNPAINTLYLFSRLLSAVGGLVLVHNLFVNAAPVERWGLRLTCIALAALFGYDLNLFAIQAIYKFIPHNLLEARGVVSLVILPLLVLTAQRKKVWKSELQISRQVVFHSLSLVAIGGYLMLMAFGSYGLRLIGGNWGAFLQISFLVAMLVALSVFVYSGRVRSWLKVKINKHFFAYKYDYREEWLKFIHTVSQSSSADLESRVIEGVCNLVDSPGGVIWMPTTEGVYVPAVRWNFRSSVPGKENAAGDLVNYLATSRRVINFDELREGNGTYGSLQVPDWVEESPRVWLAVPMVHQDRLVGFLVLERSRAVWPLNWEDFDMLRTVGRQVASYVMENHAQRTLIETRQFESFNRRFAFVMHDIKNLVSQLALVMRNAEKHADNPDFQRDMMLTLKDSVARMNDLLARLQQHNKGQSDSAPVDLIRLLRQIVDERRRTHKMLSFHSDLHAAMVQGDEGRLEQIFIHLIQNAIDASSEGTIDIDVRLAGPRGHRVVRIAVMDEGVGMSEDFIRHELFKPFRSTKAGGFGLGAYEAREIVKSHGGHLEVVSKLSEGSVFTIELPHCESEEQGYLSGQTSIPLSNQTLVTAQ